ncbi:MAG: SIMPL domain-containing protein [Candidatus Krumholzibacteriota bacterium]|nr:SIMPL domain-containing protein [Candidatus Krumholzibacteriota bacterium]
MQNQPDIVVRGRGTVEEKPDRVVLGFEIEGFDRDYAESVRILNERVASLRNELGALGVEREALKTTSFSVDSRFVYEDKERVFVGFEASHNLRLTIPMERKALNEVFTAAIRSSADAEIRIHFEASDQAGIEKRVLEAAVADAREKANVIAAAAGRTLGSIRHISHSWSEVSFTSLRYSMNACMSSDAMIAPDLEPADVSSSDTVEIVWELL